MDKSQLQFFNNRVSVRNYKEEKIGRAELEAMLSGAAHAPTTGNMQLYSVVITDDEEGKKALSPLHFNQPMVVSSAAVLTFCIDIHRFKQWCEASGTECHFNNIQMLMCAAMDTMAFAQQFVTIAEMQGWGTCYLGTTLFNCEAISKQLALPAGVIPMITVTLGRPAGESPESGRLPLEAISAYGAYPERNEKDVKDLYAEKESREDSKMYVKENGLRNLAEVFTTVRYPKSMNEPFSESLLAFLKKSVL